MTALPTRPHPSVAAVPLPRPADGLALLGMPQGAHAEPHGMVRRADGQVLQLTPLLYAVLAELGDAADADDLAARAAARSGRELAAEDVRWLLEERLQPLGVLDGDQPSNPVTARPLLALRLRWEVTDPVRTRRLTAPFTVLFHPVVVAAVLAAFATGIGWLAFNRGLALAARQALHEPLWLLVLLGLTLVSAGFHEFGHAAACRRAGAAPGGMGFGLYLLWPAFWTDVTDAYRLDRRGRLLVDLGGLWFNVVFAVAGLLAWGLTGVDALLLVLPIQVLQMARQLLPFLRYDGYHLLADLTGVPDLFTQVRPTLTALLPRNWGQPSPSRLRPGARALVIGWTLVTVPLLVGGFGLVLSQLPRMLATAAESFGIHRETLAGAVADADVALVLLQLVRMLVLGMAPLAIAYLSWRFGRRALQRAWRGTQGSPLGRASLTVAVVGALLLAAWALQPDEDWQPIAEPTDDDRVAAAGPEAAPAPDTVAPTRSARRAVEPTATAEPAPAVDDDEEAGAVAAAAAQDLGPSTVTSEQDNPGRVTATTPATSSDEQEPAPTPRSRWKRVRTLPAAWTWSWPRPSDAREQDNLALAAVDADATWTRSFTTELIVVPDGGTVDHRNEAHAYARCTDCGAVAAALQVVLLPGEHRVVVPRNLAVAANEDCTRCTVTAVANQLVVSITEEPSPEVLAQVRAALNGLTSVGAQLDLDDAAAVRAAFHDAQREVLAILAAAEPTGRTPDFSTDAQQADEHGVATDTTTSQDGPSSSFQPADDGTLGADAVEGTDGSDVADEQLGGAETTVPDGDEPPTDGPSGSEDTTVDPDTVDTMDTVDTVEAATTTEDTFGTTQDAATTDDGTGTTDDATTTTGDGATDPAQDDTSTSTTTLVATRDEDE